MSPCTLLPSLGAFGSPWPSPQPVRLSLSTGDPGVPPAEPHGEGAALLQLRRLRHPLRGPGGWCWARLDGGRMGRDEGSASQTLLQLLMVLFFWLQDTWTPEEVIPKRLREKQK